jgi:predicted dehydrogenase
MVNWGIIGLGNMGKIFLHCFDHVNSNIILKAYASKSFSTIKKMNKNIQKFDNYEKLIKDKSIDAIYISTLNNIHKDLVLLAIENNKKILCEKPLGINFNEVRELYESLKDKKNVLFEAIAYRSHPQTYLLKKILADKEIGKINKIESNFGFKIKKIKNDSRLFNKKLGGGSILDLGCYPISFFNLFNENKNELKIIKSELNYCDKDVDLEATITLSINNNIEAIGNVSLKENLNNICKIYCDNATITVPNPWLPSKNSYLEIETKSRYHKQIIKNNLDVYSQQLNDVSDVFRGKLNEKNYLVNIDESLKISKILDSWLKNK